MEKQTLPPFDKRRRSSVAKFCPCGKKNHDGKFAPFKGYEDKGYCHSCGEKFLPELKKDDRFQFPTPKRNETGNKETKPVSSFHTLKEKKQETPDCLPFDLIEQSMKHYEQNYFVQYLVKLFREKRAMQLVDDFLIGTARNGGTVFHQIDFKANLRQSKIIVYDPETGKRRKDVAPYQVARKLLGEVANIQPCFFNECDLTLFPDKPVAIVESEKTAILCSVFLPKYVWLATGGKNGIKWNYETCHVLKKRIVILYPDLDAYENWTQAAEELKKVVNCKIAVSDLLEKYATEEQRKSKLDLADFIIKQDESKLAITDESYPVVWH